MELNKKSIKYFNSTSLVFIFLFVNFFIFVPILYSFSDFTQEQENILAKEISEEIAEESKLAQQQKNLDENNKPNIDKEEIEKYELHEIKNHIELPKIKDEHEFNENNRNIIATKYFIRNFIKTELQMLKIRK